MGTMRSRWPHRWAWALACATCALVAWGGFVTATSSGMAFKDWLTSDGVAMPFYPWLASTGEKFIEHGHRLLGMLSGILTIALVASCWTTGASRGVKLFALALLAGVIGQGVLGGMRVVLDERLLALVHGCTGPLFLAACGVMVVVTSGEVGAKPASGLDRGLVRFAVATAGIAYLQLMLGALVRHTPLMTSDAAAGLFQAAVYFHVLMAAVVTIHVVLLAAKCLRAGVCRASACGLTLILAVQVLLGASSWIVKYGMPSWFTRLVGETGHFNRASDLVSASIVTAHGAIGALIVALAAAIAVRVALSAGAARLARIELPAVRAKGALA